MISLAQLRPGWTNILTALVLGGMLTLLFIRRRHLVELYKPGFGSAPTLARRLVRPPTMVAPKASRPVSYPQGEPNGRGCTMFR